ncbi:hypothetical protein EIP91_006904 [Steccherinum ochraceum]|uniref:Uncharacterized protein n=1 Tax=Steccherinum ochraceum TaxID=92696 RepID=A0A4R0R562_9APHY|nr:hypothetical protein EIP91_006904 [Steccherinum ochraceum]
MVNLRLNVSASYYMASEADKQVILRDEAGAEGYGGIPSDWEPLTLSDKCPNLRTITLVMLVANGTRTDFDKPHGVVQWRYALRLLSMCPSTVTYIAMELYAQPSFDDDAPPTLVSVETCRDLNWRRWNQVLERFPRLDSFRIIEPGLHFVEGHGEIFEPDRLIVTTYATEWEAYVHNELLGYNNPKNSVVISNVWATSRDENLNPSPEESSLVRFLAASGVSEPTHSKDYVFGFGSRLTWAKVS